MLINPKSFRIIFRSNFVQDYVIETGPKRTSELMDIGLSSIKTLKLGHKARPFINLKKPIELHKKMITCVKIFPGSGL